MTNFDWIIGVWDLLNALALGCLASQVYEKLRCYTNGYKVMRTWLFWLIASLVVVNITAFLFDIDLYEMTEWPRVVLALGRGTSTAMLVLMFKFQKEPH